MRGFKSATTSALMSLALGLSATVSTSIAGPVSYSSAETKDWTDRAKTTFDSFRENARNDWESARSSLNLSIKNLPAGMNRARTDINWLWEACKSAANEISIGVQNATPDFNKGMSSLGAGFRRAGESFKNEPFFDQTKKHI